MAPRSVIDPKTKETLEEIGEEIVKAINGHVFEVEGTPTATVKYADKSFKKKPIPADLGLWVEYAYVGQRGLLIFGMSPEDSQEWEFAELTAKELDTSFPLMGTVIREALGVVTESEKLEVVINNYIAQRANKAAQEIEESKSAIEDLPTFGMF